MEQIKLDLIPNGVMPVCHASQYDDGRTIRVNLYEGGVEYALSTETIELDVRKGDGNVVTKSLTVTSGNKYVDFDTTEQMCAIAGANLCELKLTKGDVVIGTLNFILDVESSPMEGGVESKSEINNLQSQIDAMVAHAMAGYGDIIPTDKSGPASIANFTTSLALPLVDGKFGIVAQQAGSGTPSPSNPRAISGYSGMNIGYVDFNQLVKHNRSSNTVNDIVYTNNNDGSWSVSGTASADAIYYITNDASLAENHVILYSYGAKSSANNYRIGDFNNGSSIVSGDATSVIIRRSGVSAFVIGVQVYSGKSVNIKVKPQVFDLTAMFGSTIADYIYSLEQGSTGAGVALFRQIFYKDYYAYNAGGTKVTVDSVNGEPTCPNAQITFGSAGTVYGGEVDLKAGKLRVTPFIPLDMGTANWVDETNGQYGIAFNADYKYQGKVLCPVFESATTIANGKIIVGNSQTYPILRFKWEDWNGYTTEQVQSALSGKTCYIEGVATPIEYDLTTPEIVTLIGTNNIWCDTNGDTEVRFKISMDEALARLRASDISFEPTATILSTNVQDAIEEVSQ